MIIKHITLEEQIKFLKNNAKTKEMMIIPKKGTYWGLYHLDMLVGTIGFVETTNYHKIDCHYVLESFRKSGFGKILFDFVLSEIGNKNIMAYATNDSIRFYKNNGFTILKEYSKTYKVWRERK